VVAVAICIAFADEFKFTGQPLAVDDTPPAVESAARRRPDPHCPPTSGRNGLVKPKFLCIPAAGKKSQANLVGGRPKRRQRHACMQRGSRRRSIMQVGLRQHQPGAVQLVTQDDPGTGGHLAAQAGDPDCPRALLAPSNAVSRCNSTQVPGKRTHYQVLGGRPLDHQILLSARTPFRHCSASR
jgi:hypothetical protein